MRSLALVAALAAVGVCSTPSRAPEPSLAAPVLATAQASTDLQVTFLDVGSGDCIWIRTGDDGVPDRTRSGSAYGKFFQAASAEVVDGELANFVWGIPDGFELDWGSELDVQVLHSSTEIIDHDLNNVSIVIRLAYSDNSLPISFMFTGDAEEAVEKLLVAEHGAALQTTVLKAGHHGSHSSSTLDFLRNVQPEHVVISTGNQSFSGTMLPAQQTFDHIDTVEAELNRTITVWRTDRGDKDPVVIPVREEGGDDTVIFRTNGATMLFAGYADEQGGGEGLDPARCQAIATSTGKQCKRSRPSGADFCWQHD